MSKYSVKVVKGEPEAPLIVLNSFGDEWKKTVDALDAMEHPSYSLIAVTDIDWNKDLSPWKADAVFKGESGFAGGADQYLAILTEEIIPEAAGANGLDPAVKYICGYSMAGLFALYSLYKTDVFSGAASCSGSLWFPGFREFISENGFASLPSKIYLSLGDREALTKNKLMASVEDNTRAASDICRSMNIDILFEMNKGGHFNDPEVRLAKGIRYLLT